MGVATVSAVVRDLDLDLELAERHRLGDARAFDEVYARFEEMVYNLACRLSGNRDEAADLTQEIFLRVFRHLGSFGGRSTLKTWIYRIAVNHCRDRLSRWRPPTQPIGRTRERESPLCRSGPRARGAGGGGRRRRRVEQALTRLPRPSARPWSCGISKGSPTRKLPTFWGSGSARCAHGSLAAATSSASSWRFDMTRHMTIAAFRLTRAAFELTSTGDRGRRARLEAHLVTASGLSRPSSRLRRGCGSLRLGSRGLRRGGSRPAGPSRAIRSTPCRTASGAPICRRASRPSLPPPPPGAGMRGQSSACEGRGGVEPPVAPAAGACTSTTMFGTAAGRVPTTSAGCGPRVRRSRTSVWVQKGLEGHRARGPRDARSPRGARAPGRKFADLDPCWTTAPGW